MKKPILIIAALAVIALIVFATIRNQIPRKNEGTVSPRIIELSEANPFDAAVGANQSPRYSVDLKELASSHIENIRESARQTDERTSAVIAGANLETSQSIADDYTAQLEQNLLDSITSLTQQLINEPGLTTNTIALLSAEDDPQTMLMIARALGEAAAALGDKFPYDLLLDMAVNDPSIDRRQAALLALGYMGNPPADLQAQIADIANKGLTSELRTAAISTMAAWMGTNPQLAPGISDSLLAARSAAQDPIVRGLVIQSIGNSGTPLTQQGLEAMTDAILHETEQFNRSLAAVALGSGASHENRESVLTALETAYLAEPELNTQRHIITQIAKAAGADAETFLRRLPTPDPLLAQDVNDFIQILSNTSHTNWGAVWDQKSNLDSERGTYPAENQIH